MKIIFKKKFAIYLVVSIIILTFTISNKGADTRVAVE